MKIKWSQRLPLQKLKQLYLSEAGGFLNEELLDDIAVTLYLRCKDIVAVDKARNGEVRCPFCYANELTETYIKVGIDNTGKKIDNLQCHECFKEFSYNEFVLCTRHEQLNLGGAEGAFTRFISEYEQPASPQKRMLQVDRLIHEFHYSLRSDPEQPTRSVGPNLLNATLTESVRFLDELSGLVGKNEDLKKSAMDWQKEKEVFAVFFKKCSRKNLKSGSSANNRRQQDAPLQDSSKNKNTLCYSNDPKEGSGQC